MYQAERLSDKSHDHRPNQNATVSADCGDCDGAGWIAPIAMEEKLRFAIREGGRTVGAGVVSKIID